MLVVKIGGLSIFPDVWMDVSVFRTGKPDLTDLK